MANVNRDLDHWFNTAGFERNASKGPAAFHKRVFPEYIDGLRSDMTNQWNVNAQREFKITERMALQVRFDAINLQNRSQFDVPNQNAYSTDFGRITQQSAALNRLLQIHGRLLELDHAVKTGRAQADLSIDALVVEMCK